MSYPDNFNLDAFDRHTGGGAYEMPENIREELDARYNKVEVAVNSILTTAENQLPRLLKSIGKSEEETNSIMLVLENEVLEAVSSIFDGIQKEAKEYHEEENYFAPKSERRKNYELAKTTQVLELSEIKQFLDYFGFLKDKNNPPLSFETWKLEKEIAEKNKRAARAML